MPTTSQPMTPTKEPMMPGRRSRQSMLPAVLPPQPAGTMTVCSRRRSGRTAAKGRQRRLDRPRVILVMIRVVDDAPWAPARNPLGQGVDPLGLVELLVG